MHATNASRDSGMQASDTRSLYFRNRSIYRFLLIFVFLNDSFSSDAAARRLQDEYIRIRARYGQNTSEGAPAIPITVRQLEAIIRLSESLAKLTLSNVATEKHVEEAVYVY